MSPFRRADAALLTVLGSSTRPRLPGRSAPRNHPSPTESHNRSMDLPQTPEESAALLAALGLVPPVKPAQTRQRRVTVTLTQAELEALIRVIAREVVRDALARSIY